MRTEKEWLRLVREQESSGMNVSEYCRGQGIRASAFGYWRKKIGPASRKESFARVVTDDLVSVELPGGKTVRVSRVDLPAVLEALCAR